MSKLKKKIIRYSLKKRKLPDQNRRQVAKNLSLLSILVFFIFLINFAVIIGTDSKFGKNLSELSHQVHQKTEIVPAKRGTIYDRNGAVIAEDATTYNVYAIIDKTYKSAKGEVLYVEESQYNQVADVFNRYLGMEKTMSSNNCLRRSSTRFLLVQRGTISAIAIWMLSGVN